MTIQLNDVVMVSDPCYTEPTWCQSKLTNVLAGTYHTNVGRSDEGAWGNRVSSLEVIHEDYVNRDLMWEEHSEVGVDSGQCGIFSYDTYRNDAYAKEYIEKGPADFDFGDGGEGDAFYSKMCQRTLSDSMFGSYNKGIVSCSGYGDGGYPLDIVRNEDGYIVAIRVTYIFPEDESDCCGVCGGELEYDGTCEYCEHTVEEQLS